MSTVMLHFAEKNLSRSLIDLNSVSVLLTDAVFAVGRQEEPSATLTFKAADRVDAIMFATSVVRNTLVLV